jgi:hypothetical protein
LSIPFEIPVKLEPFAVTERDLKLLEQQNARV